ncbi:MAG: lysine-sensitive aspartokinase 3 [Calditrichia bacterium]
MASYRVLKFGGTSVANAEAMRKATNIVQSYGEPCVVVLSATSGTTNDLITLIEKASTGDLQSANTIFTALKEKHQRIAVELGIQSSQKLINRMNDLFRTLESIMKGIYYLGEVTPRAYDAVLATGELLSTLIFSEYFVLTVPCKLIDAREYMITDTNHKSARPVPEPMNQKIQQLFTPILNSGTYIITQGFIGKSTQGETTTLGRGGSDFTASLIGSALSASRIEIWTDVSGIYSADPRLVPAARPVEFLTFDEASELAYFGARVLHPSTILPAMQKHIPVVVKNTHQPEAPGTLITQNSVHAGRVQAIAFKPDITMITIESTRMLLAYGFLEKLFGVFSAHETPVDLISTSEISVSLTIDDTRSLDKIVSDLEQFSRVTILKDMAMIALVGHHIRERKGFLSETFSTLSHIPVEMVSFGGSNINLSLIVQNTYFEQAVRALHHHFFEGVHHES